MQRPSSDNLDWWIEIDAESETLAELQRLDPNIRIQTISEKAYLSAPAFEISGTKEKRREEVRLFEIFLNGMLLLEGSETSPVKATGNLVAITPEGKRHFVMLAETVRLSVTVGPVCLTVRGSAPSPNVRPWPERLADLINRDEHFARALKRMENAGTDLRELFKVMEAIERGNGGFPMDDVSKSAETRAKRRMAREAFCQRIGLSQSEWAALLRSCRPERHEYVHDDGGVTPPASFVRKSLMYILKGWFEREVPA